MIILAILVAWLLTATLVFIWRHGATLRELWLEPMLKRPILIFESDDWARADPFIRSVCSGLDIFWKNTATRRVTTPLRH